jgi:hypothetical protein
MNNAMTAAANLIARFYSLAPALPFTNALLGI